MGPNKFLPVDCRLSGEVALTKGRPCLAAEVEELGAVKLLTLYRRGVREVKYYCVTMGEWGWFNSDVVSCPERLWAKG